jgi:hypothetical protein
MRVDESSAKNYKCSHTFFIRHYFHQDDSYYLSLVFCLGLDFYVMEYYAFYSRLVSFYCFHEYASWIRIMYMNL